jgi:hypothetical protein
MRAKVGAHLQCVPSHNAKVVSALENCPREGLVYTCVPEL